MNTAADDKDTDQIIAMMVSSFIQDFRTRLSVINLSPEHMSYFLGELYKVLEEKRETV